jgi:hypothetical protein
VILAESIHSQDPVSSSGVQDGTVDCFSGANADLRVWRCKPRNSIPQKLVD